MFHRYYTLSGDCIDKIEAEKELRKILKKGITHRNIGENSLGRMIFIFKSINHQKLNVLKFYS